MHITRSIYEEIQHNVRRGFRSDVNAKLDNIIELVNDISNAKSIEIQFDNSIPNKYAVTISGTKYLFNTYDDLKNALLMIKQVI